MNITEACISDLRSATIILKAMGKYKCVHGEHRYYVSDSTALTKIAEIARATTESHMRSTGNAYKGTWMWVNFDNDHHFFLIEGTKL